MLISRCVFRLLMVLLVALSQPLCLCEAGRALEHHHGSELRTGHQADREHSSADDFGDEAGEREHHGQPGGSEGHGCACDSMLFFGADKDPFLKKSTLQFIALESRPCTTGIGCLPAQVVLRPRAKDRWRQPRPLSILHCSLLI